MKRELSVVTDTVQEAKTMAEEALKALATLALFGEKDSGGGLLGDLFGSAAGSTTGGSSGGGLGDIFKSLAGYANGGSFGVGGSGGTDSQLVAFRASPNEQVTIQTPNQQNQSGGINVPLVGRQFFCIWWVEGWCFDWGTRGPVWRRICPGEGPTATFPRNQGTSSIRLVLAANHLTTSDVRLIRMATVWAQSTRLLLDFLV